MFFIIFFVALIISVGAAVLFGALASRSRQQSDPNTLHELKILKGMKLEERKAKIAERKRLTDLESEADAVAVAREKKQWHLRTAFECAIKFSKAIGNQPQFQKSMEMVIEVLKELDAECKKYEVSLKGLESDYKELGSPDRIDGNILRKTFMAKLSHFLHDTFNDLVRNHLLVGNTNCLEQKMRNEEYL